MAMSSSGYQKKSHNQLLVIGAGFGRTGTMSLSVALEKLLHGKCYHMKEVFMDPKHHMKFWEKTVSWRGGAENVSDDEWREFFSDYVAAVDLPASTFYETLARIYPDAKIILTVRDPSAWYKSCINTIAKSLNMSSSFPTNILTWFRGLGNFSNVMNNIVQQDLGSVDWNNEELMKKTFVERNERVKDFIPADRLLIYEIKEGWGPLCKFLKVPVPDEPFPRINDTNEFNSRLVKLKLVAYVLFVGVPVIGASILGCKRGYIFKFLEPGIKRLTQVFGR